MDIKFNVGFGEDLGKKVLKDKKKREEEEDETAWEKYQRKKKEKKKEKKAKAKQEKDDKKKIGTSEVEDKKKTAELELLIGMKNNGRFEGEFKANTKDKRFDAVIKDKAFAIDPTNKNYRKIADGEFVKEQKLKR